MICMYNKTGDQVYCDCSKQDFYATNRLYIYIIKELKNIRYHLVLFVITCQYTYPKYTKAKRASLRRSYIKITCEAQIYYVCQANTSAATLQKFRAHKLVLIAE
jgi:hypothetical protein